MKEKKMTIPEIYEEYEKIYNETKESIDKILYEAGKNLVKTLYETYGEKLFEVKQNGREHQDNPETK